MTNIEIGERIAERRKELRMTMEDLSQKVGVARSTIQRYEAGKIDKIKMPVIESIANALGVDPCWLIGKSDCKKPTTDSGDELVEYLEVLKNRPECRMLFQLAKGATKADVEQAVRIIEAIRNGE